MAYNVYNFAPSQIARGRTFGSYLKKGTNFNQNVNGSVTPQEFSFTNDIYTDRDIYIMVIKILIGDSTMNLKKFGAINYLTNGWKVDIIIDGVTCPMIQPAKSVFEIFAQTCADASQGLLLLSEPSGPFLGAGSASSNSFLLTVYLSNVIPYGIRMSRGDVNDKIVATVQDDLTGLDFFNVQVAGYSIGAD